MWPNLGVPATVFWQWANQTQNALLNHYNRCAALLLSRAVLSGLRFAAYALRRSQAVCRASAAGPHPAELRHGCGGRLAGPHCA
jgi:hypothetical protein